jgi:transposase-like protein
LEYQLKHAEVQIPVDNNGTNKKESNEKDNTYERIKQMANEIQLLKGENKTLKQRLEARNTPQGKYKCNECGDNFVLETELENHNKGHLPKFGEKPWKKLKGTKPIKNTLNAPEVAPITKQFSFASIYNCDK